MAQGDNHDLDTFPKIFRYNAERWGNQVCMRKKELGLWKQYTWQDAYSEAMHFGYGLLRLGFAKGDKISIIGDNDPQWCCGQMGAQMVGGVAVGVFSDVTPEEAGYIISHSDSSVVLANDQEQVDKILKIRDALPLVKKIIYWDKKGLRNYDDPILLYYNDLLEMGREDERKSPDQVERLIEGITGEDLCLLLYTSGTTGTPRGVMIGYKSMISSVRAFLAVFHIKQGDNLFSAFPAAWMGEQLFGMGAFLGAGPVVNYPEETETVLEDLREISPTMATFGPRQWEGFCSTIQVKMREADILKRSIFKLFVPLARKRVRCVLNKEPVPFYLKVLGAIGRRCVFVHLLDKLGMRKTRIFGTGSASLSPDTFEFLWALGIKLRQVYAGTECGFAFGHYENDIQSDTVGCPAPGIKYKVSENQELLIAGDTVFKGYYKDPEATKKSLKDGWFYTGDAVIKKDDGHVVYIDRVEELGQLSTGAKYSPQYIEGRLRFSPFLKDALILGKEIHPFVSAILNIDFQMVGKWAEDNHINYTTFVDLSQRLDVAELVLEDVQRVNEILTRETRIKRFVLLHKEFDPDEGELTRTRKLKRGEMHKSYGALIEAIYDGKDSIEIDAPVKYRDGRTGIIKTQLNIRTVQDK